MCCGLDSNSNLKATSHDRNQFQKFKFLIEYIGRHADFSPKFTKSKNGNCYVARNQETHSLLEAPRTGMAWTVPTTTGTGKQSRRRRRCRVWHWESVGGTRGWRGMDSQAGWLGDRWRQPGAARAMVEVPLGDAQRPVNVGMAATAQLWVRRRARHRASSVDDRGSGDGNCGTPMTATVVQW
jgi:hypothetical protein